MKSLYILGLVLTLSIACRQDATISTSSDLSGLVDINGTKLHIETRGQGESVIVIHGGPGLGYAYLMPHLEDISNEYHLILYDQRASGTSDYLLDSSQVTLDKFVEDIDGIRMHYGIDKVNLLAHSFGGLLAMKYAVAYPQNVDKIVLISSLAPISEINSKANNRIASQFTPADIEARTAVMRSEAFQQGDPASFEELMKIGFRYQFGDSAKVDLLSLKLPADFNARSQVLQGLAPDLVNFDWRTEVSDINQPVLLLYGRLDPLSQFALPVLESLWPQSTSMILDDTGHFPFIEQAAATTVAINAFLRNP